MKLNGQAGFAFLAAPLLTLMISPLVVQARDLDKLYRKDSFAIDQQKFTAYVADSESKRADGLMFINHLEANVGMLFVFEHAQPLNFWMKNTVIPLSIGFFDGNGTLIDVQEMRVANSLMSLEIPTYQSRGDAQFALEMNPNWFTKHKLKTGAHLHLIKPSTSSLLNQQLKTVKTSRQ